MGKGRDRRRRKRHHRRAEQQQLGAPGGEDLAVTRMPTAVNWTRIAARFRLLRGRGGVRIAFIPFGPIVEARNPSVLAAQVLGGRDSLPS